MKIEKQPRDDHQVKLIVEFEAELVQDARQKAAREIARRVKIPGFRPGKAPYPVILRQVGEPTIMERAIEFLIDEQYPQILDEAEIQPYTNGQLENITSTDPVILEFLVPLQPEVTLGDYQSIRLPYNPADIEEKDIDEVIENAQEQQAVIEPVSRAAQVGDLVSVHLTAQRMDPPEDADATLLRENSYQILVRKETPETGFSEDEWPFPGFSYYLIDLNSGDEKTISYQFPEDYQFDSLRGVNAQYILRVDEVKSRTLPEVDENFLANFGEYENLTAFREEVRKNLEAQAQQRYDDTYNDSIIESLIEQAEIKYPPQMLESELDDIIYNFKRRMEQSGTDFELYLKTRRMSQDELREEAKPLAEKQILKSLVLLELAKLEDLQVDDQELMGETQRTLGMLNQSLSPTDAQRLMDQRIMNNLVGNIMLDMLSQRSLNRLREIASEGATRVQEASLLDEQITEEDSPLENQEEEPATMPVQTEDETPVEAVVDKTLAESE